MASRSLGLVVALWLTGCGLVLDLDPPDQGGLDAGRVDAGPVDAGADAAPPGVCELDEDCPSACSVCEEGACVSLCPEPTSCGQWTCDEGTCSYAAGDDVCAREGDPSCAIRRCTEDGCRTRFDDAACDDGIPCTTDTCDPSHADRDPVTGCVNIPDDGLCSGGHGCGPFGCGCASDADCTAGPCHIGASCVEGVCQYDDAGEGDACENPNRCALASRCQGGSCVAVESVICSDCERCHSSSGVCVAYAPAEGTDCDPGDPCGVGQCDASGTCVSAPPDCDALPIDPCVTGSTCIAGACEPVYADDGTECEHEAICVERASCRGGVCTPETFGGACAGECTVCDPLTCTATPTNSLCGTDQTCDVIGGGATLCRCASALIRCGTECCSAGDTCAVIEGSVVCLDFSPDCRGCDAGDICCRNAAGEETCMPATAACRDNPIACCGMAG